MAENVGIPGRVNGQRYLDLPEGHRTTLVIGMTDMLTLLTAAYMDGIQKETFTHLISGVLPQVSIDIRKEFDMYMAEDPKNASSSIASCFLSMLISKAEGQKNTQ